MSYQDKISKLPVYIQAFLLNGLIAGIVVAAFVYSGNGTFSMLYDYAAQEIPYNVFMNQSVKDGLLLWNWGIDLGGNFLEAFGFYNLGSPFFWLLLPFESKWIPYLMPWMIVLKFAVAGALSALYFSRHLKTKWGMLSASVLYAYSGFQLTSLVFYLFHDVVAFFPLLPYCMERLVEEKKRGWFAVACCFNILVNYVFFFQAILFLIIFFIVKYIIPVFCIDKDSKCLVGRLKQNGRDIFSAFLSCVAEVTIGVLISGALILPVIEGTIHNPRISNHLPISSWLLIKQTDILRFVKAILFPAEPMNCSYSVTISDWYTNAAYLPMTGFVFVLAYLRKGSGWLKNILIACLIMAIVPVLSHSFSFLNVEDYKRWYYIICLYFALATGRVLERSEKYDVIWPTKFCIWSVLFFFAYTNYKNMINNYDEYLVNIIFAVCSMLYSVCVYNGRKKSVFEKQFLISLAIVSMILMGTSINNYQKYFDNTMINFKKINHTVDQGVFAYLNSFSDLHNKLPYRYYFDEGVGYTYYNLAMMNSLPSINSFLSTVNHSVLDFYFNLGVGRHTMALQGPVGTNELLGARYVVSLKQIPQNVQIKSYKNKNNQEIYISENPRALPIGFTYERYIKKTDFEKLPKNQRALAMLQFLVVPDEEVPNVNSILDYSKLKIDFLVSRNLEYIVNKHKMETIQDFKTTNNSFSGRFVVDKNKYAFLSVPFSQYWHATVNGKEVSVLNVNGLMSVPVLKGENNISFRYEYLPLKWGCYSSIFGIFLLTIYLWFLNIMLAKNGIIN